MTIFPNGTQVVRRVNDSKVWNGEVVGQFQLRSGRMCVVCESREGYVFVSDPSHLEKVNVEIQETGRTDNSEVA